MPTGQAWRRPGPNVGGAEVDGDAAGVRAGAAQRRRCRGVEEVRRGRAGALNLHRSAYTDRAGGHDRPARFESKRRGDLSIFRVFWYLLAGSTECISQVDDSTSYNCNNDKKVVVFADLWQIRK